MNTISIVLAIGIVALLTVSAYFTYREIKGGDCCGSCKGCSGCKNKHN